VNCFTAQTECVYWALRVVLLEVIQVKCVFRGLRMSARGLHITDLDSVRLMY